MAGSPHHGHTRGRVTISLHPNGASDRDEMYESNGPWLVGSRAPSKVRVRPNFFRATGTGLVDGSHQCVSKHKAISRMRPKRPLASFGHVTFQFTGILIALA